MCVRVVSQSEQLQPEAGAGVQCTQMSDNRSRLLLPTYHTYNTPVLLAVNNDDDDTSGTPGAGLAMAAGLDCADNRGQSTAAPAADDNSNNSQSCLHSSAMPHQQTQSQVVMYSCNIYRPVLTS